MSHPGFVLPRDPWPRLRSERATRVALAGVYALVTLATVAEVARSLARVDRLDYTCYPQVGAAVLAGTDPYALGCNTWPPFFLFVAAALALASRLSPIGTLLLWHVASVLAAWGVLELLARLFHDSGAGGREPTFWPRSRDRLAFGSAGVLVPFLFSARLFQDNLQHGQINVILLFLCLGAFVLLRQRRAVRGGFALALAASLKAVPLLLVGYLVYKRAWRGAGWTLAFLVLLNVIVPVAVFGPAAAAARWRAWRGVAPAVLAEPVAHHPNQALLSALKRLLTAEGGRRDPIRLTLATWPTAAVLRLFWIVAALGAVGLALLWRRTPRDLSDPRCAGEFAVCLGAMTLVSPLAWTAHYVTLVAPASAAWAVLRRLSCRSTDGWWRWSLWWASFACLTLSASGFVSRAGAERLESLSVITVGAVCVVALALSLLPRLARASDSA